MLILGTTTQGESFALPLSAATQKFAFLARTGAGKSYAASKMAEQFYHAAIPFVVLDPVGVWYGLRLAADGQGVGLSIPVFGGEFGDVPLEPSAGALVADLIVDRSLSCVLDVSSFRKGQRKQFVTEFAEALFHRKKTARSPLHLFLEEAQTFVPQRTMSGEERMLGAFEDIGKIGRNYGIGLTLISQRPQSVNKDVLNQAECLFVLQLNASQERKAIKEWIDAQGIDAGATVDDLPNLPIGEAVVWSPQWLRFFGRVQIALKETYNASATPTFDTTAVAPRPLEAADLAALRDAMQTVVEQAEAHDPTALKRRIADLERQLQTKPAAPVASLDQVERVAIHLAAVAEQLRAAVALLQHAPVPIPPRPAAAAPTPRKPAPAKSVRSAPNTPHLRAGERRILDVLARYFPRGLTRQQVATLSGFSVSGGTFGTYIGTLRRAQFMAEDDSECAITQAGFAYLGLSSPPPPLTTGEIVELWREALRAGERAMLDALVGSYPRWKTRDWLANTTGYEMSGGTFGTYLGTLRRNGLIEQRQSEVRASATLFLRA